MTTTQVSICQLQGMLGTYFTIPDTPTLRDVNEVRQVFAASVYRLHYYQSMEQTWNSTMLAVDIDSA